MSHNNKFTSKVFLRTLLGAGLAVMLCTQSLSLQAASIKEENIAANQAIPIESNQIDNWPQGPVVNAASAILMEADTGTILYAKDIHAHHYPASITKILTTLIASERCSLDEIVTFSSDAVFGIPKDSNHIAMDVGDTLTMEQCLNAILIRSANEVSYAVAEHIGGTWEGFAKIMNTRAKELGCVDSNFVNPNGLPDENHYTSAYDMAMIGRAFFANEMLCKITTTSQLVIPKEEEDLVEWNKMELIPGRSYSYEYLVGCKTGYTNDARSTLVSCAEKDGMKLICVVLRDEAPSHYEDTIALFDYGFSNFEKINISQAETKYNIDDAGYFYSDNDIFGNSQPMLSLNKESCVILPKTAQFTDTESSISYETDNDRQAAIITYTYHGVNVGSASVDLHINAEPSYTFDDSSQPDNIPMAEDETETETKEKGTSFIFINVFKVLLWLVIIGGGIGAVIFLIYIIKNTQFDSRRSNRRSWIINRLKRHNSYQTRTQTLREKRKAQIRQAKRRRKRKRPNRFRDYDF